MRDGYCTTGGRWLGPEDPFPPALDNRVGRAVRTVSTHPVDMLPNGKPSGKNRNRATSKVRAFYGQKPVRRTTTRQKAVECSEVVTEIKVKTYLVTYSDRGTIVESRVDAIDTYKAVRKIQSQNPGCEILGSEVA